MPKVPLNPVQITNRTGATHAQATEAIVHPIREAQAPQQRQNIEQIIELFVNMISESVAAKLNATTEPPVSIEDENSYVPDSGFVPGHYYDVHQVARILFGGNKERVYRVPQERLPRMRELGKNRIRFRGVDLLYYAGEITKHQRDAFLRTKLSVLPHPPNASDLRQNG